MYIRLLFTHEIEVMMDKLYEVDGVRVHMLFRLLKTPSKCSYTRCLQLTLGGDTRCLHSTLSRDILHCTFR